MIFSDLGLGGVQTKMIKLAHRLDSEGHECWIFLKTKGKNHRVMQLPKRVIIISSLDIRIFNKHPFWGWRFALFVSIIACIFRPTSIFVSLSPLATQLLSYLSVLSPTLAHRVIVNEDTLPSMEYANYHEDNKMRVKVRNMYLHTRAVIAVSQSGYEDLMKNYNIPSPPLQLLPNWTSFIDGSLPNQNKRKIDVVYGGRLSRQKRPELLAELFSALINRKKNLKIHVYGDGPEARFFESELEKRNLSDVVHLYSPKADFISVLRSSKIVVFTSLYEGMPFVALEAMRHGTVIACLAVPGLRELVVSKKTGIMTETVSDLAKEILKVLNNKKKLQELGEEAFLYGKKNFSEENENKLINLLLS